MDERSDCTLFDTFAEDVEEVKRAYIFKMLVSRLFASTPVVVTIRLFTPLKRRRIADLLW